ncbi:MAG: hypothetical protein ACHQRM_03450 [Bacteroidia bacterium]
MKPPPLEGNDYLSQLSSHYPFFRIVIFE